jgi:hypothetical protein
MQGIREVAGTELEWVQPHALKREFELRAGEARIASLELAELPWLVALGLYLVVKLRDDAASGAAAGAAASG